MTVTALITMRETNAAIILRRKAARLRKETGNQDLRSANDNKVMRKHLVERALLRPLRMLFFSPIVFLTGLYMALTFGMTYLLFATFPSVFRTTYGWSVGVSGLAYLSLGFGCTVSACCSLLS